jgi:quercetin dioxygenase-like cupin family protein
VASGPNPKVIGLDQAPTSAIEGDGASGVTGMPLLGLEEGTGQFDFRAVAIAPGGVSADHSHPWEQANYILRGKGRVRLDDVEHAVEADDFVYVPPNVRHVFTNDGEGDLVLLAARGARD